MKKSHRLIPIVTLVLLAAIVAAPARGDVVAPGETHGFTQADWGDGTPFFDSLLKGTDSWYDPAASRAEAFAMLSIAAINSDVIAFSRVNTDFQVTSSGAATVLDATVSADVQWNGLLFGAGILGAGASVKIEMSLIDADTGATTGKTTVVTASQDSTGLKGIDVGGTVFGGAKRITFPGKVIRGHAHYIELRVTCSANAGLIGLDVGCIYMTNAFGLGVSGDYFAKWNSLSITVEQDINERFDILEAKIDALDTKLDEVLRLLHTPPGLRETDIPACEGLACNFPQNPRRRRP